MGRVYNLELQEESEGTIITSLEAILHLNQEKGKKTKTTNNGALLRRISRFPEKDSVNACDSVAGIAVSEGLKCCTDASTKSDVWANLINTVFELSERRYPTSCWKARLVGAVAHDPRMGCKEAHAFVFTPRQRNPSSYSSTLRPLATRGHDASNLCTTI